MTDNPWYSAVPLYEGENEADLKERFAQLWARYPTRMAPEIGMELFAKLPQPMRGLQAGGVWGIELAVVARRDELIRNGGSDDSPVPNKEQTIRELVALARTETVDPKERVKAWELASKLQGFLKDEDAGNVKGTINIVLSKTDAEL